MEWSIIIMQQNNPPPQGLPPTLPTDVLAAARMPPGDEYEEIREQVRSPPLSLSRWWGFSRSDGCAPRLDGCVHTSDVYNKMRAKWLYRILDDESDEFKSSIHSFVFNYSDDLERGICMMATFLIYYWIISSCLLLPSAIYTWWIDRCALTLRLACHLMLTNQSISLLHVHSSTQTHRIAISPLPT